VAVLSDIHGNWTALERVAAALEQEQVQVVLGLGDYLSVSLGSRRVVEWMRSREHAYFVRGDNDGWESYERFRHLEREDSRPLYRFVTQLPEELRLELGGVPLLLRHGYPCRPIEERGFTEAAVRETQSRAYVESVVDFKGVEIACFGDLHRPAAELHQDGVIAHIGSVGAPRDQQPGLAKYLLLELGGPTVRITQCGVPFCREAAVRELRAGYREDPGPEVWLARWLGLSEAMAGEWRPLFEEATWLWQRRPSGMSLLPGGSMSATHPRERGR
jgi:putative phosphoesterase